MKYLSSFAFVCCLWSSSAHAAVPAGQAELNTWWSASKSMWLGKDAYEAKGTTFSDGQCSATLNDGIIIPVYTGRPPLSERVIGVVFVGSGDLSMELPRRADAWSFANHMVLRNEKDAQEMAPVAREGAPYTVGITRAMILGADPMIGNMLLNRMPVGAGVFRTEGMEGVNEEYVVTESRGKVRAKMISTNMLPQRTLRLEQAGLDIVAMLRQDRLMHEELGYGGQLLRSISDFRTEDRFHVAAHEGAGIGPVDHDQWLTCFKDPLGQSDVGEKNIVFAHGEDGEGQRHFQRIAGMDFEPEPGQVVARPSLGMEAVKAESTVVMRPVQRRNYMSVEVESLLEVRAVGGDMQHVALSMPTERSDRKDYKLLAIETEDGKPLARVALHADTAFFIQGSGDSTAAADSTAIDEGADPMDVSSMDVALPSSELSAAGGGEESVDDGGESSDADEDPLGGDLEMQTISSDIEDSVLFQITPFRSEVLVLLPKAIKEGETTKIRVKWATKWLNNNRTFQGRYMGVTTGARRFLPEMLPSPGGTVWHAVTTFSYPPGKFFPMEGAITGDTVSEVVGDDGWRTIVAEETHARGASVGVGKWLTHSEPATGNLPAVRVNLMSSDAFGLGEFPPEVRRIVSFMQRFLPELGKGEIEVYQDAAMLPSMAASADFRYGRSGLLRLRTVKTTAVGDNTEIQDKYPALTQSMLARQVAHQYWGQRTPPNTSRDEWLIDALADAYGAFYVRAGLGKESWATRLEQVRERFEEPTERTNTDDVKRLRRPVSLTEPGQLSDVGSVLRDDYGFLIVADTLRERVGNTAFFLGLDRLAQRRKNKRVSTDDLQAILEETSGQDLSDFFDYWIHGGRIPKVEVSYAVVPQADGLQQVEGCIEADVPFGSFDVPVEIKDASTEVAALVDVVDGSGEFTVSGRSGDIEVLLDKGTHMVLYKRSVKQVASVEKLACKATQ
jgi:hypothetical protein